MNKRILGGINYWKVEALFYIVFHLYKQISISQPHICTQHSDFQKLLMEKKCRNEGPKSQEGAQQLNICPKCEKIFSRKSSYAMHMKIKHEESSKIERKEAGKYRKKQKQQQSFQTALKIKRKKRKQQTTSSKCRSLQFQMDTLQDNIYTFLGDVGEQKRQQIEESQQLPSFQYYDETKKNHNNFKGNKVICPPHQNLVKSSNHIPHSRLQLSRNKKFFVILNSDMIILQQALQKQNDNYNQKGQLELEEYFGDQFSLNNICKLIQNYPKRRIAIKYPLFSIFLLWLGKICKSEAFSEIYLIIGQYIASYFAIEEHSKKVADPYNSWKKYFQAYLHQQLHKNILSEIQIFNEQNYKEFLKLFVKWVDLFQVLSL